MENKRGYSLGKEETTMFKALNVAVIMQNNSYSLDLVRNIWHKGF